MGNVSTAVLTAAMGAEAIHDRADREPGKAFGRPMKALVAPLGAACVVLAACSSSSSSGPSVDPSKRLVDLTPTQQASLCDGIAQHLGGYSHTVQCDGG